MQNLFIKDINNPGNTSNSGVKLAQSNENPGGFSDLLQNTIEKPEQYKGNPLPEKRQEPTSRPAEQVSKKDTQISKEDTQVSKKDTQVSKEDTQVSKKDTQVSKEDTQVSKEDTQVSKEDTQIKNVHLLEQLTVNKQADQTIEQLQLSSQAADKQAASPSTTELDLLEANTDNLDKQQISEDKILSLADNVNALLMPLGLMNPTLEKIDDTKLLVKTQQTDKLDSLQLSADTDKRTKLDQALLDKLQMLLGQEKGAEVADLLDNKKSLEVFKDQVSKVDNLKSFNQLVDGLSDSGNKNVQQALQSILGVHKAQDSSATLAPIYKQEVQGKITQQVNDKIAWMTQHDIKQARLVLDPSNLGNIDIHIAMHKNEVSIHFISNNQFVKDAIESSMHQLSAHLTQDGLTLTQSNVQMQHHNRQAFGYEAQNSAGFPSSLTDESTEYVQFRGMQDGTLHLYV
jgi:flagellar hook-length control protein FliK